MSILIGLLPALCWGIAPIIVNKLGGKAIHQLMGMAFGEAIIGVILYLIFHPDLSWNAFIWSFIGGAAWSFAQLTQFQAFKLMNVSEVMPISAGLQLIEIPLIGVIVWNEWGTTGAKLSGFLAIIILIVGIIMTNYNDKVATNKTTTNKKKGIWVLIIGSLGYAACNVLPKIPNASGIVSVFSQTLGMLLGGLIITACFKLKNRNNKYFFNIYTIKNIIIGLIAGIGSYGYLTSMNLNGVATAFPLTQLNTVISTIGGIWLLNEHKDKRELTLTIIGLILIIASAFIIGQLS